MGETLPMNCPPATPALGSAAPPIRCCSGAGPPEREPGEGCVSRRWLAPAVDGNPGRGSRYAGSVAT